MIFQWSKWSNQSPINWHGCWSRSAFIFFFNKSQITCTRYHCKWLKHSAKFPFFNEWMETLGFRSGSNYGTSSSSSSLFSYSILSVSVVHTHKDRQTALQNRVPNVWWVFLYIFVNETQFFFYSFNEWALKRQRKFFKS